jgi:hypothetical protein
MSALVTMETFACANCGCRQEREEDATETECGFCRSLGARSLVRKIRAGASR